MTKNVASTRRRIISRWQRVLLAGGAAVAVGTACLATPAGADTTTSTVPASTTTAPTPTSSTGSTSSSTIAPSPSSSSTTTSSTTSTTSAGGHPIRNTVQLNPHAGITLDGVGSSFAAPAILTWTKDVSTAPYNLSLNYSSTNSGDGRYEFTNQTTDFAASDIGYVGSTDTTKPSFPFIFVPITAGGIAFMYRIDGLSKTLQLTTQTACAVLTGGITNWNDSHIAASNPGVTLPNLPIIPVTESDSAGTNYVLEEWCIDEQPSLWAAFVHQQETQSGGPTDGVSISATSPNSNWPGIKGGLDDQTTTAVASDVSTHNGAIGAVQVQYASDLHFGQTNPANGVASVQNASGDYTQPNALGVASALAYATQQSDGTHVLNFNGVGPNVYNPSTYSYLLTPTTGWQATKGAVLSAFVNYVLTLGQGEAPKFGYASLGLSLEQYGVNAVKADVPGAVAPTAAEQAAYACGDFTPAEVAAGATTPTCGVTNGTAPPPAANAGNSGATVGSTSASGSGAHATGTTGTGTGGTGSGGTGSGGTGTNGGSSVDPGVSLTGSTPLAFTGSNLIPLALAGCALVGLGWAGRRRVLRGRRARTP